MTTTLTITAQEFRALVEPVLPMASRDDNLYVLTSVLIESDGKWLAAMTTDRFRIGMKRIEKRATDDDPTTEWPEFRALIPTRAVRSLLTTFKPRRGTLDPTLTFTVDDNKLTAEAVGLFDLFDAGRFVHTLQDGEYPDLRKVVRNALDVSEADRQSTIGVNPAFLADFKSCGSQTLRVMLGGVKSPIVMTDDDGFLGLLMPRTLASSVGIDREDWTDFLAPKPEPKKRPAAKKAAVRKPKAGAA